MAKKEIPKLIIRRWNKKHIVPRKLFLVIAFPLWI